MTFDEALEKLAEKWPEKFSRIVSPFLMFEWWSVEPVDSRVRRQISDEELSQDDLDDILSQIGWEYEVFSYRGLSGWFWQAGAWKTENRQGGLAVSARLGHDLYSNALNATKLEAARAVLIAVVERELAEKPQTTENPT